MKRWKVYREALMAAHDLILILPMLVIAGSLTVVMLVIAFKRSHQLAWILTLSGIICSFLTLSFMSSGPLPLHVTPLFVVDKYALFYSGLILAGAFAVTILSYDYLKASSGRAEEYYVLLLISTLGAMVLTASSHFASFFLGLETLSIPLYVLIAYPLTRSTHIEAAFKYLILSAVSISFLVFGMALVYSRLGTMEFSGIATAMAGYAAESVVLTGLAMMIVGIGFKLAVVPFHMWTPDVYQGAPAPVTAFIATVSKGAMFALLLRYFAGIQISGQSPLFLIFSIIAVASMFTGNLLALLQNNVKRLLAYSSISHFGYLLIAFLSAGTLRVEAVTYYLVAYFITTIGSFGIVALLSRRESDADDIEDYSGLYARMPWLAMAFTLMLLSLAGIPLTVGFIGKFYIMSAGIGSALWLLVVILVINSVIGLYYYLRVIAVMFIPLGERPAATARPALAGSLVIGMIVILLLWWGVYPAPLVALIQNIALAL
jgi:NADH-quinone oxidoreductase subunit N